jgi:hypothetical protein
MIGWMQRRGTEATAASNISIPKAGTGMHAEVHTKVQMSSRYQFLNHLSEVLLLFSCPSRSRVPSAHKLIEAARTDAWRR